MKLLLRRNQRSGLLGKVIFSLNVRADLTEQERSDAVKYRLGDSILYKSHELADRGSGLLGLASRWAFAAMTIEVTVRDLVEGKHIECKDIVQMLYVEEQIKEAARNFADVLRAAAQFGGEEVIEI